MRHFRLSKKNGYALLMVLTIVGIAALSAGSILQRTYTVSTLNQRAKQYQSAMYAAEAAVEKVYARFRYDYVTGGEASITNNVTYYRTNIPNTAESPHWANFQFWNAQGVNNQTYVMMTSNRLYQVLDGSYAGLSGWRGIYRVISNARPLTGLNPVAAGVQQEIALDTIPAFQFAIFYNGQLEFTQCAPLTVRGRTHANGPICMGAASGNVLRFEGVVSTTSSIVVSNLGGYSNFATPEYAGSPSPGRVTGAPTLQLPIGTNNSAAAVREIINLPPTGESVSSAIGQQRFYNKAGVVLLVSNTTVTVSVKDLGAASGITSNITYNSSAPTTANSNALFQALPFLTLTNRFTDYREGGVVMPTQLRMDILKDWLVTNDQVKIKFPPGSGVYPTIMYVGDFRSGVAGVDLHAVRLRNGTLIPTNGPNHAQAQGFTLATVNPLYVWGNYNLPNAAHAGQANPSATFPASLVSDAITVLSGNWQDHTYGNNADANYAGQGGLPNRNAQSTTINAAVIAGSVYTTGTGAGNWSGGVHNLTRLLEDWNGPSAVLTLNSSIVNLYNSVRAWHQFQNPNIYYTAPTRNFNFNTNYLVEAKLPPGTPTVSVISRYKWTTTPVNNVTYNGP